MNLEGKTENNSRSKLEKEPKFIILDDPLLDKFIGRPVSEVIDYCNKKYGKQLAGLEQKKYLNKNPDKIPSEMKKENLRFYFLRDRVDRAYAPAIAWVISRMVQLPTWKAAIWYKEDKVILVGE